MKSLSIFLIFIISINCLPTQINLPVRSDTQQKLSRSLQRLAQELQYFRTPYQNKLNLYKRIALTQQYLQQLSDQVSQYNNVVQGEKNSVDGSKNVIIGNYNSIKGSNNYVFIEKYIGQANGDLLIGKWRIQIQKKKLILVSANHAISFINQQTNRKYLRYLTQKRTFSYGSTNSENIVTVLKDDQDAFSNTYNYGASTYQYTQNSQYQNQQNTVPNYGASTQVISQQTPIYSNSVQQSQSQQNQVIPIQPSSQIYPIYNSIDQKRNQNIITQQNPSVVLGAAYQSRENSDDSLYSRTNSISNSQSDLSNGQNSQQYSTITQSGSSGYLNNNFNNGYRYTPSYPSNSLRRQSSDTTITTSSQGNQLNSRYYKTNTLSSLANSQDNISNFYSNPSFASSNVNLATWRNRS